MTLRDVLVAAAEAASGVAVGSARDGGTVWSVRGVEFATLSVDGNVAAFLLDPIVAGAAARTPDVVRSQRGPGWVEMRPAGFDGHVADRANAWFLSAHRRLTGPGA
jgi:hypothetical protein